MNECGLNGQQRVTPAQMSIDIGVKIWVRVETFDFQFSYMKSWSVCNFYFSNLVLDTKIKHKKII